MTKIQEVMSRIFDDTKKNCRNFEIIRTSCYSSSSPVFLYTSSEINRERKLIASDIDALLRFLNDTFDLNEEIYSHMLCYLSRILVNLCA